MGANITAVFSNGFTDTYKGERDVKAAWAIIRRDSGQVLASGHSLNREAAAKTANGDHYAFAAREVTGREWKNPRFGLSAKRAAAKRYNAETRALAENLLAVEVVVL